MSYILPIWNQQLDTMFSGGRVVKGNPGICGTLQAKVDTDGVEAAAGELQATTCAAIYSRS